MIVDIDLLPGAESIDKDRYTYPTIAPNAPPFAPLLLCVKPVRPAHPKTAIDTHASFFY
jgi:hypothetical protein